MEKTLAPLKVSALVPDEHALNARTVHDQPQAPTPLRHAKDREEVKLGVLCPDIGSQGVGKRTEHNN